jgi:sialic acid synthase SpsE/quercetin dioxygenase-like cupin family protein
MMKPIPNQLVVLELANNHMGDIAHAITTVKQFSKICRGYNEFNFAFKLQYRDLDTFIHIGSREKKDLKHVKRFMETRLSKDQFLELVDAIKSEGFIPMCTPFDERSVELIEKHGFNILKVGSCSFTDWPLLERISETSLPIIASTAGATVEDIDRVVSFLTHRSKHFAILHCVAEYPTPDEHLNLGQIDFLKKRYPNVRVGFSTHEDPAQTNTVRIALAKGATILEKHVCLPNERYIANAYSANPQQVIQWLEAARETLKICGITEERVSSSQLEEESLHSLRRGLFAKHTVKAGERIEADDIYFAFPAEGNQYTANEFSKYIQFCATAEILPDSPVNTENAEKFDTYEATWKAVDKVKALLGESGVTIPGNVSLELSHHYGMDLFEKFGLTMITVVNREYCKKLLISLPGQVHPEQYHEFKEETFHVLHGELWLKLDGVDTKLRRGDVITIDPKVKHEFMSPTGSVIEEISSTHNPGDSFYTDPVIQCNPKRKTLLNHWIS